MYIYIYMCVCECVCARARVCVCDLGRLGFGHSTVSKSNKPKKEPEHGHQVNTGKHAN